MRFFPLALQQSYRNEIETASPASRLINFKLRRYLTHAAPVTSFEVPEAIRAALDKAGAHELYINPSVSMFIFTRHI
jgi:hypothetical protein